MVCKYGFLDRMPDRSHLITVLDLFHRHVKGDSTKPVPIALSFGLHAVLMSIFVLQGNGDLARVATATKQSYNILFDQLKTVSDRSNLPDIVPCSYDTLRNYAFLAALPKAIFPSVIEHSQAIDRIQPEMLAFWNPLLGGEYMLYATLKCSVGLGSSVIDPIGQLRFTLHLFNGLKIRDPTLDIPLLRDIDMVFKDVKAVWPGEKPEKGSYAKAFWMSLGFHARFAADLASGHVPNKDLFSLGSMVGADDWKR